ncbi:MAG: hypothetical protein AAFX06_19200, partial [Planctomycetota bacterium]
MTSHCRLTGANPIPWHSKKNSVNRTATNYKTGIYSYHDPVDFRGRQVAVLKAHFSFFLHLR